VRVTGFSSGWIRTFVQSGGKASRGASAAPALPATSAVSTLKSLLRAWFALPLLPWAWHSAVHAPGSALAAAVYLGLLPSAVGFVIWAYAVARLPLAVSTAALYLVPPVALAVSFVWLGEAPRVIELLGGMVSVLGVVLINRARARPQEG
jgi:drug/metabolite transporter (DMT)-like permease